MVLDRQPVLSSDALLLRPLTSGDFDSLYRIASDPMVWEQHPTKDRTQEAVFRRWFDAALRSGGALAAVDRSDGGVIGTSRFVLHGDDEVEIGWTFLACSRWGGRWNSEMKRLMLEHAFEAVCTVRFTVHQDNKRSQRAVERVGATPVGRSPAAHGGGDDVVFQLRRGC